MTDHTVTDHADDPQRRRLLLATTAAGGIGVLATALPFLESMEPSEAARAAGAPIDVDVSGIAPGKLETVEWRGKPIWVVHRTEAMLTELGKHDQLLVDPASREDQQPYYAANPGRAIRPPFFIAIGICTHLGCVPVYRPDAGAADLGANWPGGFYCPCHGSRFDLAGRVFKNVPAPRNLEVPRYMYLSETKLRIGEDKQG